ncbi:MAG: radical SAM protein [Oscillospiraceae bacterium]|jgi:MoaA/NifB/PqqE/SkfB family radical SAM enzyme
MSLSSSMKKFGAIKAYEYLDKDPDKNIPKLLNWAEKIVPKGDFSNQIAAFHRVIDQPDNNWYQLIRSLWTDIDDEVRKTLFQNFILNANFDWAAKRRAAMEQYGCNIPWAILLDPTSACNLHCTGCWAAEYGNRLNLSFDEMDAIIEQGKELGICMYIYTGGEPLMRKKDLIALCNKHNDCIFLSFTNATLIDEEFAEELLRVRNFIPAISIEGFEAVTDNRRGNGTYQKVIRAMEILKEKKLPFGVSCCYTSRNFDSISSEDFFDQLIDWGAKFAWFFHYMPVGNDAVMELLPTPHQREMMYQRIRAYRKTKPIFTLDFQNDGEYVGGCIAGGKNYLHINPNGDIEPCVFIHYSDSNIREKTLLEALRSPLFMAYHDGQPFNDNPLRPCPMLENPDKLQEMVRKSGAHTTDLQSPEPVEHLCEKCKAYAADWAPTADRLWKAPRSPERCQDCKEVS